MGSLDLEVVFIGVPKLPAGAADLDAKEQAALQSLLRENSCIAVFLSSQLTKEHFSYSFTLLWPLLHNQVPDQHAGGQGTFHRHHGAGLVRTYQPHRPRGADQESVGIDPRRAVAIGMHQPGPSECAGSDPDGCSKTIGHDLSP